MKCLTEKNLSGLRVGKSEIPHHEKQPHSMATERLEYV